MDIERRTVLTGMVAFSAVGPAAAAEKGDAMYGLISKMTARRGEWDALSAILIAGIAGMPGCLSYVVAADPTNSDIIWITEVWESKDLHAASLALPSVRDAIMRGRPLIAGMERVAETSPVGGFGLGTQR
ncbi:putative quinol monooxygenase [Novosphingobium aerophilum]|uniref:putative quinol monooxygenase n=1 Tax=Novosphingobium TaxID=165696 RepID=UPI0012CCF2D3|nr:MULTISPECIES: antibiotic biosynthesis monooxygenase [unclassified Novosphingobium]MPS69819.1 antibiotic biosynthesis monooxygenase [Novosphingobium sp.]WRT95073.1 antibiotic biosynthesis monooxygenase [Novosphingobium sp. RL4]